MNLIRAHRGCIVGGLASGRLGLLQLLERGYGFLKGALEFVLFILKSFLRIKELIVALLLRWSCLDNAMPARGRGALRLIILAAKRASCNDINDRFVIV